MDGSTDRSGEICDAYQEKDQRVRVIHQANAGVAAARNAGLKASIGEYITFVDSDDLVHPLMLETLMTALMSGDYEMSMVRHVDIYFEDRDEYISRPIEELGDKEPKILSQLDFTTTMFTYFQGQYLGVWHKLYKRSLIFTPENDFLEFRPIAAEDEEWVTRMCLGLKTVILIPLALYFYVMRDNSLTHNRNENGVNRIIVDGLKTHCQCIDLIPDEYPQWKAACYQYVYHYLRHFNRLAHGTSYADEVRSIYRTIYKNTINDFLQSPMSLVTKVKHVVFYHCPWLYRFTIYLSESIAKFRRH